MEVSVIDSLFHGVGQFISFRIPHIGNHVKQLFGIF